MTYWQHHALVLRTCDDLDVFDHAPCVWESRQVGCDGVIALKGSQYRPGQASHQITHEQRTMLIKHQSIGGAHSSEHARTRAHQSGVPNFPARNLAAHPSSSFQPTNSPTQELWADQRQAGPEDACVIPPRPQTAQQQT